MVSHSVLQRNGIGYCRMAGLPWTVVWLDNSLFGIEYLFLLPVTKGLYVGIIAEDDVSSQLSSGLVAICTHSYLPTSPRRLYSLCNV